jgi:hypothetical protein
MPAESKNLWLLSLPALLLCTTGANALEGKPGSTARLNDCNERLNICRNTCGGTGTTYRSCVDDCLKRYGECLSDPNIAAPKPYKRPLKKDLPALQAN